MKVGNKQRLLALDYCMATGNAKLLYFSFRMFWSQFIIFLKNGTQFTYFVLIWSTSDVRVARMATTWVCRQTLPLGGRKVKGIAAFLFPLDGKAHTFSAQTLPHPPPKKPPFLSQFWGHLGHTCNTFTGGKTSPAVWVGWWGVLNLGVWSSLVFVFGAQISPGSNFPAQPASPLRRRQSELLHLYSLPPSGATYFSPQFLLEE